MRSVKISVFSVAVCILLFAMSTAIFAEGTVCEISTAEELCAMSAACVSDTDSVGRIYRLTDDIDLTGRDFSPIPVMNGVFDGAGHRIFGLSLTKSGSSVGLIRRVCGSGIVKDLTVCADVAPEGSVYTAAGIVGRNDGEIVDCGFIGNVVGDEKIGGVCAENYGSIKNCTAAGDIQGQHETAGICAVNYGTIDGAENACRVNTTYRIVENATAVEIGTTLSTLTSLAQESMLDITDIGGVCGRNFGQITNCKNNGDVGYDHVGYNVGGVCGRCSGVLQHAENAGKVIGRRAVGGVCGKLEPSGAWTFSNEQTEKLRAKMKLLRTTVYELTDAVKTMDDDLHLDAGRLTESAKTASEITDLLCGRMEEKLNSGIETANELFDRVEYSISTFETIAESFSDFASEMSRAMRKLQKSMRDLEKTEKDVDAAADSILDALDTLTEISDQNDKVADEMKKAVKAMKESAGDVKKLQSAFAEFCKGLTAFSAGVYDFCKAFAAFSKVQVPDGDGEIAAVLSAWSTFFSEARAEFSAISDALDGMQNGFSEISGAVRTVSSQFDAEKFVGALASVTSAVEIMAKELPLLSDILTDTQDAFGHLNHSSDYVYSALAEADLGLGYLSSATKSLKEATDALQSLCHTLSQKENLALPTVDADFSERRAALFTELKNIADAADSMREDIHGGVAFEKIKLLADTVYDIYDIFSEIVDDALTFDADRDYVTDISSAEETTRAGSVVFCKNSGAVTGDTNAGGIVGTVSPDTALDREGKYDVSAFFSGTANYLIYAYIGHSESTGVVTAEKSSAGGIAGNMDYGMVANCNATGFATAKMENAGGIVGYCKGTVLSCNARVVLDGTSYVGGIVGRGHRVYSSVTVPTFASQGAYFGSVAGDADGEVRDNRYFGDLGGVDGVSIHGACDKLQTTADLASESAVFTTVAVTFRDGNGKDTVQTLPYGAYITDYPAVPDADGKHWVWTPYTDALQGDVLVEGEYRRPITVLAEEGEFPRCLVEGVFEEDSRLICSPFAPEIDGEILAANTVSVTNAGEDLVLHLRAAAGGKLYLQTADGTLKEHTYEIDGSYIKFEISNGTGFVYTTPPKAGALWIVIGACAGGICIVTAVVLIRRKRKMIKK